MSIQCHQYYWKDVKRLWILQIRTIRIASGTRLPTQLLRWNAPRSLQQQLTQRMCHDFDISNGKASHCNQGKLRSSMKLLHSTIINNNTLRIPAEYEARPQSHHHFFHTSTSKVPSIFRNFGRTTAFSTQTVLSTNDAQNQNLIPFLLADIGEGIKEVEIIKWFVQPGQSVQQFDLICQVQSDKATVEITSRYDGIIASLGCEKATTDDDVPPIIQVGQPLLYFYPNNDTNAAIADNIHGRHTATSASVAMNGHDGRPSDQPQTSATEIAVTILSTAFEMPMEHPQNSAVGTINTADESNDTDSTSTIQTTSSSSSMAQASPAVRRIAREYGISNAVFNTMIQGTGPNQRILKSDILAYVNQNNHKSNRHCNVPSENKEESDSSLTITTKLKEPSSAETKDKIIALRGYTRHMISTMTTSLQIPHMCFGDEIIMNNIMAIRQQINDSLSQPGSDSRDDETMPKKIKISVLALLIKAVSCAMIDYPIINSIQMMENDTSKSVIDGTILQKQNHNFGIAIDTMSRGLVVPVLHECQNKSILTIQNDIDHLKQLAYNNQLQKEHFEDMTFTISNIGSIGSGMFLQPVIVPPTLAMGAFGYTKTVPRFRSAVSSHPERTGPVASTREIYEAQIMNVTWAGDHRFLDGATIGRFHNRFRYYVEEQPMMLLLK